MNQEEEPLPLSWLRPVLKLLILFLIWGAGDKLCYQLRTDLIAGTPIGDALKGCWRDLINVPHISFHWADVLVGLVFIFLFAAILIQKFNREAEQAEAANPGRTIILNVRDPDDYRQ